MNYIRYRDGKIAYYMIPFEKEAYDNDENLEYLENRERWVWWKGR